MFEVTLSIQPHALLYDLHTKGLEVDDGAEFYTAVVLGLFPKAQEIHVEHELQQDPPELGEIVHEIDGLWESLTVRPDWGSDEIEWCASHIRNLRTMIYKAVLTTFVVHDDTIISNQDNKYITVKKVSKVKEF